MEATMHQQPKSEPRTPKRPVRTCVGCGQRDDAGALVRLVLGDAGEVAFDLAGGAFGRGAHVHPQPACLEKVPRGLSRAFKQDVRAGAREVGEALVAACDRRAAGLVLAARRTGTLAVGVDASLEAVRRGAPLLLVAVDAGSAAGGAREVERAVAEGRALAWKTRSDLGAWIGEDAVAMLAVRHAGIAGELKNLRAAADAGVSMMTTTTRATREGARCSKSPEAR
ncbi:MAG TPA: YlxR family protein [Polyangiaceae bacterium]